MSKTALDDFSFLHLMATIRGWGSANGSISRSQRSLGSIRECCLLKYKGQNKIKCIKMEIKARIKTKDAQTTSTATTV